MRLKSRSAYLVLLVRHVISMQEATEEQLSWKNKEIAQLKPAPDQPVISNGTSPYHHKDTTITLSNNNVMLTIIIFIIPIYFVISL